MKAKITKPDGTILELDDVTVLDLVTLGLGMNWPVVSVPSVWSKTITGTCDHEYPNPWFGVVPPSCKKCGQPGMPTTYGAVTVTVVPQ